MQDKVIVVTGALGVLGRAVVAELRAGGARVGALDHADGEVPADFMRTGVDASEPAAAQAALLTVAERLGGIDGLVNVAGGFVWEPVADASPDSWDRMYRINVRTAVVMSQAVLGHFRNGGSIVNVGAGAAAKAGAGMGAYAASKAGVAKLTEALAEEWKDRGVRVNAVLPSILDTPANRADMPSAEFDRWVAPEALSKVIAFLLSDEASAVTGASLPVTGRV